MALAIASLALVPLTGYLLWCAARRLWELLVIVGLALPLFPLVATQLAVAASAPRKAVREVVGKRQGSTHQGLLEEARISAAAGLAVDPEFRIRRMIDGAPSKKPKFLAQWQVVLDGMRKAGLLEGEN